MVTAPVTTPSLLEIAQRTRQAARQLALLSTTERNEAIEMIASDGRFEQEL